MPGGKHIRGLSVWTGSTLPPDTAHLQAGPYSKRGRLRDAAKVRLLTLANLDNRTRSARTAHQMVEAFERALGARYSRAMKPLVEAAACAAAIAADLQTRMIAGDASISVNDVVRAVNTARLLRLDLGLPVEPDKPKPTHADVVAAILAGSPKPAPGEAPDALNANEAAEAPAGRTCWPARCRARAGMRGGCC
jgi:hypothetical protein